MTPGRRKRRPAPDIELTASVEADELRFREVPETEVRFHGDPGHRSSSGTDRTNLPEKVDPGVTYREVRVDYRLASELAPPESRRRDDPGSSSGSSARGPSGSED